MGFGVKELPGIGLGLGSSVRGEEILRKLDHLEVGDAWEYVWRQYPPACLHECGYDVNPHFAVQLDAATT